MTAPRRSLLLLIVLGACRSHSATLQPVPEDYKTQIEISTAPAVAKPASPSGAAPAARCPPMEWRHVENNAFAENERWSFDVHWGFIKAGTAVLTVEGIEPIRQRPAYHLAMDIQATGMTGTIHPYRDRADSWLDQQALITLLMHHSVRESSYQADETVVLDPPCRQFLHRTHRLDKNQTEKREGPLPSNALDMYGALFYLRTLSLAPGQVYDLALFAGGNAFPVTARVGALERVRVSAGRFDCFPIEIFANDPVAAKKIRQIQWWLSADRAHRPIRLRMEIAIGHITADLQK